MLQAISGSLLCLIALASLGGGLGSEQWAPPASRPLPEAHHIEGVPLAASQQDWCGPAALSAVLQYHGEEVGVEVIARDIHLPHYHGALSLDLLLWARKRGYQAWATSGSPDALKRALARDRPAICMMRRRGPLADRNHYVVVRGYDDTRGVWLLDAGAGGEETVAAATFDQDWADCRRWMLVVEGKLQGSSGDSRASEWLAALGAAVAGTHSLWMSDQP